VALTDIEAVRLKSSDKSLITREETVGTGSDLYYKLGHAPVLASPALEVRFNGVVQNTGYTVDLTNGIVTFTAAPGINVEVEFTYYWSIFSDDEIQYFIDAAGGDVTTATAQVLLAIAADASKVAKRQSMAGGGGLGAVTIDTSVAARELRNTAQALIDTARQVDNTTPAEGITEPLWTEFSYQESIDQSLIRNS